MNVFNEYTFVFIAGWVLPSALLGLLGDNRVIGFWKSILISILLSPIIGLIIILASKSRQTDALEKAQLKQIKEEQGERLSEELGRLHALHSNGAISDDEYQHAKDKILS